MKKILPVLALVLAAVFQVNGGTLFYQALPASDSDANSGISSDSGYTTAVDGGNSHGTDRVINGITLYSMKAEGDSETADSCTLNALSGSLSNAGGSAGRIRADGAMKDVFSDMTFNNGAGDNSQQEIVLDPASLEAGATYDLRVYVCNSAGQNREVNLSFVGDGQDAVETGFFNEDDATTSGGGFKEADQVYYINYRYTWDGDSTPGITITQKSGGTPFVLYALTNQLVPGAGAGAPNVGPAGDNSAAGGGGENAAGAPVEENPGGENAGGDEGLSEGLVDQGDDQVGVQSDDFYNSDSLNTNGQWVDVEQWGKCWQPTNVPEGWAPYTNGTFQNCDTCGWTFVSEEPWAWACYHYGRWCKVKYGCGWCWVPGRVWAGSWVSWRQGRTEKCSCIGWAPLPPEAGCEWNVGISSWVDTSCDIGPECYSFIDVVDFGRESYSGCGCMFERSRNATVIIDTFNCTNICHGRGGTFCGGPDYKWCNDHIRQHGGREISQIHVNRYDDPSKLGGKWAKHDGNSLGLVSPKIRNQANHSPKVAGNVKSNQIDHGWNGIKDPKAKTALQNHLKQENKGKNAKNTKASLPTDVATKRQAKQHGQGAMAGAGNQAGGKGNKQHPGGKGNKTGAGGAAGGQNLGQQGAGKVVRQDGHAGAQNLGGKQGKGQGNLHLGAGQAKAGNGGFNQHPGGRNKGATAGLGANTTGNASTGQHPGDKNNKAAGTGKAGTQNGGAGTNNGVGAGGKTTHPGQSLKGKTNRQVVGQGAGGGTQSGQHSGRGNKATTGAGNTGTQGAITGGQGQTTTGNVAGARGNKGQTQGQKRETANRMTTAGGGGSQASAGRGSGKQQTASGRSRGKLQVHGQTSGSRQTNTGAIGSTGHAAGGKARTQARNQAQAQNQNRQRNKLQAHTQQQTQQQQQMRQQQQGAIQRQQQQQLRAQQQQLRAQQQQLRQQQAQPRRAKPTPTPRGAILSDLRMKKDVSLVGWSKMGIPIYQFSYINQPNKRYQGTIAQAVARIRPDAVIWRNGLMWVDYSRLDVRMVELPPLQRKRLTSSVPITLQGKPLERGAGPGRLRAGAAVRVQKDRNSRAGLRLNKETV